MPLNSFFRQPLGRFCSREGLDGLLVSELRFIVLVCSFFSRASIRFSKELILALSCAIESSLLRLKSVAPMSRRVVITRTTIAIIGFNVFIVLPFSHLKNRRSK